MNKKISRCNIKQYLIVIHYTHDASLYAKDTHKMYRITISQLHPPPPPQKLPDKNAENQHQHEETDKPTKHHVYSKIITKCQFQIPHRPHKQNTFCTKMFQQRGSTSRNHNIHIIPQTKNAKTLVST